MDKIRADFGLFGEAAAELRAKFIALNEATSQELQIERFRDLQSFLEAAGVPLEKMPAALALAGSNIIGLNIASAELEATIAKAGDATGAMAAITGKAADEMIAKYDQQRIMAEAVARYGAQSAQVEILKRQEVLRTAEGYIKQNGLTGELAQKVRDAATATITSETATRDWAIAMSGVKAEVYGIASALSQIGGGMISRAAKFVELNAIKAGKSLAEASHEMNKFNTEAEYGAKISAAEAKGPLGWLEAQALKGARALEIANMQLDVTLGAERKAVAEAERAGNAKGKAAVAASERLTKQLDKEADKWRASLSPMEKYRSELEKLNRVQGLLSADEYRRALEQLNLELADGIPMVGDLADAWGNFVGGGLRDFKGFVSSILGSFKGMIADMTATAARNKIIMSMGIGGGIAGSAGAAAAGQAAGGGGGLLGGLAGGAGLLGGFGKATIGGTGSGLFTLAGGSGLMGGLGNALSGGLGNVFSIGGNAAMAGGGMMAGIGAALPMIGMLIGGLSLAKSLFGRKLKDSGVAGNFSGEAFEGSSYKFYKGGLFRSNKTTHSALDAEVSGLLGQSYAELRSQVKGMAGVLDLGTSAIANFSHTFKFSTKGLTEDQILEKLNEQMSAAGDGMAVLLLGTTEFTKVGEAALDTLTRLSVSLTGVRQVADLLGHSFVAAGLVGGDLASKLADAFGGLEAMGAAAQTYWLAVYSEEERLATLTRQTTAALAGLGAAMPASRAEYRRMVEALDLADESSHALYAALLGMAGVMDQILPSVGELTAQLAALQGGVATGLEAAISAAGEAAKANANAAANWYKASGSIRDWIGKMRGTVSALIDPMQARANNEALYRSTLASAMAGDVMAAQDVAGIADRLLASVNATARTSAEAALAQARIMADLGRLSFSSDIEGARHDILSGLLGQQVAVLEDARAYIAAGNALTEGMISQMTGDLGRIDTAIGAAAQLTYAQLRDSIPLLVQMSGSTADVLKAIAGPDGMIRVGPVALTQSAAFSTWYEASTKAAITSPMDALKVTMGTLRASLDALSIGIKAETARAERQTTIAKLNSYVGSLTANAAGNHFVGDADLSVMAKIAGLDSKSLTTDQLRTQLAGFDSGDLLKGTVYDPKGTLEKSYLDSLAPKPAEVVGFLRSDYKTTAMPGRDSYNEQRLLVQGPLGGSQFLTFRGGLDPETYFSGWLKTNNYPAFASGGMHAGGLRLVGENGPELEATGPARIYSAQRTQALLGGGARGDDGAIVAELRALRVEVKSLREQSRQIDQATYDQTRKVANRITKWDVDGMPKERV